MFGFWLLGVVGNAGKEAENATGGVELIGSLEPCGESGF